MVSRCVLVLIVTVIPLMAAVKQVPKLKMRYGKDMPAIALGTYLGFENGTVKSKNKELRDAVLNAIDIGYRHFDTAAVYENEDEVGEAIKMKIASGDITRDDVYITTKLWNTHRVREDVVDAMQESLDRLGLPYVDLYLMHWPISLNEDYTLSDVDLMETWVGLEVVYQMGMAKSIGVSNFNETQMRRLMDRGALKPAALQIELHPSLMQKELVDYAQANDVVVMGYSPLGSLVPRFGMEMPGPRVGEPKLMAIAKNHNKTVPQVVLRWLVDRNVVPVVKSLNPKRQAENFNIFDFSLSEEEQEVISNFDTKTRFTLPSFWQDHPEYPFERVEHPVDDPFSNHHIDKKY